MYSKTNVTVVHDKLTQFREIFKQLISIHDKYWFLTEPEDQQSEEHWFEELDSEAFTWKHKIDVYISKWLKRSNMFFIHRKDWFRED